MEFHEKLVRYYEGNQLSQANRLLMRELGSILAHNKSDFVELLNESAIPASKEMKDSDLIHLFVDNIDRNKKLMLGAALLASVHNKQMNADGESELNDDCVKVAYTVLQSNFISDEEYANAGGVVGAIAGAVQGVAGVGGKALEGQQMKKHGALMMAQKKEESKAQMAQSIMAKKQAELDAKKSKEKTTRTILIVSGVVVGVALIGTIAYFALKKKK